MTKNLNILTKQMVHYCGASSNELDYCACAEDGQRRRLIPRPHLDKDTQNIQDYVLSQVKTTDLHD